MADYITADEFLTTLPEDLQKKVIEGGEELIAKYTLQQIRLQSRLTQKDVASRLGISQPSVSTLEERYSEAKISTLKRYCEAMGAVMIISIAAQDGTTYTLP